MKTVKERDMQMMRMSTFIDTYDMPRQSVIDLVHSSGFPAYKIGGRWYIDIPGFEKWREERRYRNDYC